MSALNCVKCTSTCYKARPKDNKKFGAPCDWCNKVYCKDCEKVTSTEIDAIVLSQKSLLFYCSLCKNKVKALRLELENSKAEILKKNEYIGAMKEEWEKKYRRLESEYNAKESTTEDKYINEQLKLQEMINKMSNKLEIVYNDVTKMKDTALSTISGDVNTIKNILLDDHTTTPTYAEKLINKSETETKYKNIQKPTIIIKSKNKQNAKQTEKDVMEKIKPGELNVGVRSMKTTKQGHIIIKCDTKQEIEKIKTEAENKLNKNYSAEIPKRSLPRVKIVGYEGIEDEKELEKDIRKQNTWINNEDSYKIVFLRRNTSKGDTTIFMECSLTFFHKCMSHKKICIGWQRCPIFEDIKVTRCHHCQGFYHKKDKCTNERACEFCSENHEPNHCLKLEKKCANCIKANSQFKLNYEVSHSAADPQCPSTKYHMELLRGRIDYGF